MADYLCALRDLAAVQGFQTHIDEDCGILQIAGKVVNFGGHLFMQAPKDLQIYVDHIYIDNYLRLTFGGSPLYLYGQLTPLELYEGNYIGKYYNDEYTSLARCRFITAAGTPLNRQFLKITPVNRFYAYNHGPCYIINLITVHNIGTVAIIGINSNTYYVFECSERVRLSADRVDRIEVGSRRFALLRDDTNNIFVISDKYSFYNLIPFTKLLESKKHIKAIEGMFIDTFRIINDYAQKNR